MRGSGEPWQCQVGDAAPVGRIWDHQEGFPRLMSAEEDGSVPEPGWEAVWKEVTVEFGVSGFVLGTVKPSV